jgi:hypothetical protein
MASIWWELKRRKVVHVAAVYAVMAWLLIQIIDSVSEPLTASVPTNSIPQ